MTIYFVLAAVIGVAGILMQANASDEQRRKFLFFSFGLMILLAGLRAPNVGIDLAGHYAKRYMQISAFSFSEIPLFSRFSTYEIGYCYFCKLLTFISSDVRFYIFATSLITYSSLALLIYYKSPNVIMSTLLVLFSCQFYMYLNIIRQALAVSFVLFGYIIFDRSKKTPFFYLIWFCFIIIASLIHNTAIICVLLILFSVVKLEKKRIIWLMVLGVVVYVFYDRFFNLFAGYLGYQSYSHKDGESVGHINFDTVYNFALAAGAFLIGAYTIICTGKSRKINEYANPQTDRILLYASYTATLFRMLIFQMNILNRFTYYFIPFVIIMYPYAIARFQRKTNQKTVFFVVYLLYLGYFIYMTVKRAALFYGVVPYQPFW